MIRSALVLSLLASCVALAAAPDAPVPPDPATFRAFDLPSDDANTIAIEWGLSPSDGPDVSYIVEIASEDDAKTGTFKLAARVPAVGTLKSKQPKFFGHSAKNGQLHYVGVEPARAYPPDKEKLRRERDEAERRHLAPGVTPGEKFEAHVARRLPDDLVAEQRRINRQVYHFRLAIVRKGGQPVYVGDPGQPKVVSARAVPNLFKWYKLNNLLFSLGFCSIVFAFIQLARRNPNLFIRKIAGLEAVEEAIGRATEMGKSVFFVHGLGGMGDLATIAAVSILSRVARRSAEYDTRVRVMNNDPIVLAVSQEVVKQAYTEAGRPDAYNADDVALVASDQFSYAAAVNGRMVRERPATIFMMGSFAAESLLLAETGNSTGAIQIAGTDSYTQIPFFITSCDYTLIGEELYAASAYLSREPRMLGSLRGQDVGKAFLMLIIVLGSLALTLGKGLGCDWSIVQKLFQAF